MVLSSPSGNTNRDTHYKVTSLIHIDFKSMLLGGALSIAVGSGLYGLYLKKLAPPLFVQAQAYELVNECYSLLANNNAIKIEQFLQKVETEMSEIHKSDAVVAITNLSIGETPNRAIGMGTPLVMCIKQLESRTRH